MVKAARDFVYPVSAYDTDCLDPKLEVHFNKGDAITDLRLINTLKSRIPEYLDFSDKIDTIHEVKSNIEDSQIKKVPKEKKPKKVKK